MLVIIDRLKDFILYGIGRVIGLFIVNIWIVRFESFYVKLI